MPALLRRVDSPATPVASWRPGAVCDGEEEEEKTARIPDVMRMLAMSIGADEELEDDESLPATPFESGVVPRVVDTAEERGAELLHMPPLRPPAFALPSAPEVENEPEPRVTSSRQRLSRTVAAAVLAGVVLFLLAIVGTKPYFLAARAPRATTTHVDPRVDHLAVKRPQPVFVTVTVPVAVPRAVSRVAAPVPRRGIIRVVPF